MFNRIFPRQFDNNYRGHWLAIWILVAILLLKSLQGVQSIINTREIAIGADGIPIDIYGAAGADMVLSLFALLGLYLLLIPLQSIVVLIRYRSMIPFMYLSFLVLYAANRALHLLHPSFASSDKGGQSIGFYVNLGILAITVIGFVLSLTDRAKSPVLERSAHA